MRDNRAAFLILALLLGGGLLVVATGRAGQSVSVSVAPVHDLPAVKVFAIDESVVKLDTRTGAVYLLRGSGGTTGSGDQWAQRVDAVEGTTSGMLDVQQVATNTTASTFLVDCDGERTWILKWRGNANGEWQEVRTGPR